MGYQQLLAARPQDLRGKYIPATSTLGFLADVLQQPRVENYKRVPYGPASYEALADVTGLQVVKQQDPVNVSRPPWPSSSDL